MSKKKSSSLIVAVLLAVVIVGIVSLKGQSSTLELAPSSTVTGRITEIREGCGPTACQSTPLTETTPVICNMLCMGPAVWVMLDSSSEGFWISQELAVCTASLPNLCGEPPRFLALDLKVGDVISVTLHEIGYCKCGGSCGYAGARCMQASDSDWQYAPIHGCPSGWIQDVNGNCIQPITIGQTISTRTVLVTTTPCTPYCAVMESYPPQPICYVCGIGTVTTATYPVTTTIISYQHESCASMRTRGGCGTCQDEQGRLVSYECPIGPKFPNPPQSLGDVPRFLTQFWAWVSCRFFGHCS